MQASARAHSTRPLSYARPETLRSCVLCSLAPRRRFANIITIIIIDHDVNQRQRAARVASCVAHAQLIHSFDACEHSGARDEKRRMANINLNAFCASFGFSTSRTRYTCDRVSLTAAALEATCLTSANMRSRKRATLRRHSSLANSSSSSAGNSAHLLLLGHTSDMIVVEASLAAPVAAAAAAAATNAQTDR